MAASAGCASSTSNRKRKPAGVRCGSDVTTPVTSRSRPSSVAGKTSASSSDARQPDPANPSAAAHTNAAPSASTAARRHALTANSSAATMAIAAYDASGQSAGCCSCSATPISHASARPVNRRPVCSCPPIGAV
jgi:hypothetical protein